MPEAGVLSILCDGAGRPRALVEVTEVTTEASTEASTGSQEVVERFRVVFSG